ncbi:amidohydrolase [Paenibacillus filicis]|uniref:Amidohydrolase n=1 Tax=Paenibacillus filicis TaxID=669464 RepID=A0ABU9DFW4_9BACL
MMTATNVQSLTRITEETVRIRRQLHQHPELSSQEFETSALVAKVLREAGLDVQEQIGGTTGVVGLLHGSRPGRVFALRADMDALPLEEKSGLPFASLHSGVMHACGHDMHTAILLGTALALSEQKSSIQGSIKFIFQPAEETGKGARQLIDAGVLHNPQVDAIAALHCWPDLPAGTIGVKSGTLLAASDGFSVRLHGKGGHAAYPHKSVDAVVIAAAVIQALQTIVSRNISPLDPVVISVTQLNSQPTAGNVIPAYVDLGGSVRSHDPATRASLPSAIERIVSGVASSLGGSAEFTYRHGVPSLHNDPEVTELIARAAAQVIGPEQVVRLAQPSMGGEDFARYLDHVPGAMFRLGTANDNEASRLPLHSQRLIFDEHAIETGISILTEIALQFLTGGSAHHDSIRTNEPSTAAD